MTVNLGFWSLKLKFTLAIVLVNSLSIAAYYYFSTSSFKQQFEQYLIAEEIDKVNSFADIVAAQYRPQTQDFSDLGRQWPNWVSQHFNVTFETGPRPSGGPGGARADRRPPPPNMRANQPLSAEEQGRRPPPEVAPKGDNRQVESGGTLRAETIVRRLALFTPDQRHWHGPHHFTPSLFVPVYHQHDVVAYLGYRPSSVVASGASQAFAGAFSQSQKWLVLVLAIVNLACIVILMRIITGPIKQIMSHAKQLATGNFAARINFKPRQDEVGMLMANMNSLANTLDRQQSAQKRWLANIAHELRTPLAVLKGEIEAIVDGIRPNSLAQLQSLHHEVDHLQHLVEDLRLLSMSEMGQLNCHLQLLDIGQLMQEVVDSFAESIRQAGLQLSTKGLAQSIEVTADPYRLKQLFYNLLANSQRYTDAPGQITIELINQPQHHKIIIEDSAPGVAESQLSLIFEPLYRVDESRNRCKAGSGLGMSICQVIADLHGGIISASASQLGGLCVEVILPKEVKGE